MSTWYRTGTASFTNGSTSVSGSGTAWIANARTGDALHAPDGRAYEIVSVNSNTSITLAHDYLGSTASGADYAIQPTRGITVEFNDNAVSLLSTVQSYVDTALAGRFPNGSAGAPSHSFASDTDTGLYHDAADRLGFSAGGARRAFLSTTAFQIDVPVTGVAVTQSPTDTTAGRLVRVQDGDGRYFGKISENVQEIEVTTRFDPSDVLGQALGSMILKSPSGTAAVGLYGGALSFARPDGSGRRRAAIAAVQTRANENQVGLAFFTNGATVTSTNNNNLRAMLRDTGSFWIAGSDYYANWNRSYDDPQGDRVWHEGNTTVDGSGALFEASPIVRLHNDQITEPNQPVGATMQRVGPGHYTLTDCPPLATEGWRIHTPADVNGNKLVAITEPEYDTDTETLTVRTFDLLWSEGRLVPGDPMDIPEGEFVMLRFDSPDEEAA